MSSCLYVFVASGCRYNGVLFKEGEQWNDGCDLQCICEDEMSGVYRCNDRYVHNLVYLFH